LSGNLPDFIIKKIFARKQNSLKILPRLWSGKCAAFYAFNEKGKAAKVFLCVQISRGT